MSNARSRTALFATVETDFGPQTVRLGKPTRRDNIDARWYRVDNKLGGFAGTPKRDCFVLVNGTAYPVRHFEARTVDALGRGLGRNDHFRAVHLPFRALRTALRFNPAKASA